MARSDSASFETRAEAHPQAEVLKGSHALSFERANVGQKPIDTPYSRHRRPRRSDPDLQDGAFSIEMAGTTPGHDIFV